MKTNKNGKLDVIELTNQLNSHLRDIELLLVSASIKGTDSDEIYFGEKYDAFIGIVRNHIDAISKERKSL